MAKKKNSSKTGPGARSRREQAAAREQEKQAENAAKSRRMGNAFLYAFLSLIAVFCLYTLIRVFCFPAKSVSELRSNFLFISLFALPYLIMTVAVLIRVLRKKARESASAGIRRAENLLFFVVLIGSFALFSIQMTAGSNRGAEHKTVTALEDAMTRSGYTLSEGEESNIRSALEPLSLEYRTSCGSVAVIVNYHEGSGLILNRFLDQVRENYGELGEAQTEVRGLPAFLWPAEADQAAAASAICVQTDHALLILELKGPADQVQQLRPLLQEAAGKALAGSEPPFLFRP